MSQYSFLFDANVLYSAPMRDALMRLAVTDLFKAKWTADIHREWIDAFLRNEPHRDRTALERTIALCFIPTFKIPIYAAAILWRASAGTTDAGRIVLLRWRVYRFNTDLVFPMVTHVVDIRKPGVLPKAKFLKRNVRGRGMQFKRAISHRINIEKEQVNSFPTHGYLQNPMQLA